MNSNVDQVHKNMQKLKIHDALETIFSLIREINKYLEIRKPWQLVKNNKNPKSPAATCLYVAAEVLRISSILLTPFMPEKAKITLNSLSQNNMDNDLTFGLLKLKTPIKHPGSLFPRIEE